MAVVPVVSNIGAGYNRTTINNNFENIVSALEDAFSRSGVSPNTLNTDIDLNSNDLLNVGDINVQRFFINGQEIDAGEIGLVGDKGWSPSFAIISDGAKRVLQLVGWTNGEGDEPTANVGDYIGENGFVSAIGDAVDIRGPQGATGPGSGDLVAAQNLSDIGNPATAFANIIQPASQSEIAARTSDTKVITPSNANFLVPLGVVFDYTGPIAPNGWIFPYGQAISRTTYSAYFALVGTTYGIGDGSTTFNVPDLRGRVVAGQDDMGGTSANRLTNQSGGVDGDTLGGVGGAETHTLTITQMPSHNHTKTSTGRYGANGQSYTDWQPSAGDSDRGSQTLTTNNSGGDGAHNNVQPTIILNKILFVGA